jgi:NAD(P)H-dependent nitrite reductase small subunit
MMTTTQSWKDICAHSDLVANSGVCALVNEQQVALFYLAAEGSVFAVSNFDPFGQANVLSRGLICSQGDTLTVASPLYKQHFCLQSGRCLEDEENSIPAWQARINNDRVELLI